ncbi:hypothetical protein SeMB42_g03560 [Synchytrium endobioticum]|uniref:UBC core domain-containing protein n=1 Tax=Synchytrium endobioticum TaxID=286115 RepID=A0A507CPS4_9FUNG|nr:hypothetical protein SeLEV6574_g06266 [Synchytrium endobioticum]TPX46750.1 hypothetical protein SeMB42_g03560 [Synchytrium endobioticum]
MSISPAVVALSRQFRELSKSPIPGFIVSLKDDDIFEWEVGIIGPPGTAYAGGYFVATMKFPQDYPFSPPTFAFKDPFWHPNVYNDGKVCISILHPPGDDEHGYEHANERWLPTQTPESILLSIVSLIPDPNLSSPANVDAGVQYRNDRRGYEAKVRQQVEMSKKNIPKDVVLPITAADFVIKPPPKEIEDDSFWYDDAEEDDDGDEDMDDGEDNDDQEEDN